MREKLTRKQPMWWMTLKRMSAAKTSAMAMAAASALKAEFAVRNGFAALDAAGPWTRLLRWVSEWRGTWAQKQKTHAAEGLCVGA